MAALLACCLGFLIICSAALCPGGGPAVTPASITRDKSPSPTRAGPHHPRMKTQLCTGSMAGQFHLSGAWKPFMLKLAPCCGLSKKEQCAVQMSLIRKQVQVCKNRGLLEQWCRHRFPELHVSKVSFFVNTQCCGWAPFVLRFAHASELWHQRVWDMNF